MIHHHRGHLRLLLPPGPAHLLPPRTMGTLCPGSTQGAGPLPARPLLFLSVSVEGRRERGFQMLRKAVGQLLAEPTAAGAALGVGGRQGARLHGFFGKGLLRQQRGQRAPPTQLLQPAPAALPKFLSPFVHCLQTSPPPVCAEHGIGTPLDQLPNLCCLACPSSFL